MVSSKARFLIALKRDKRAEAPPDWLDHLEKIDGLQAIGESGENRILVEATQEAIDKARDLLGDHCHIERLIRHEPMK